MTNHDYHSRPELSASQVCCYLEDPIAFYHYHVAQDWPRPEPTPQMQFGSAVHRMIELGGPEHVCAVVPEFVLNGQGHRKGKAYIDWVFEHVGKQIIKPNELNPFEIIWNHLNANKFTRKMLDAPNKEQVILWEHGPTGMKCRSMIDLYHCGILIDWKTTRNTGPREFQRDAWQLKYHVKLAFYSLAVGYQVDWREMKHVIAVAIGNSPGYAVRPYEIDPAWLAIGRDEANRAIEEIAAFNLDDELDQDVVMLSAPTYGKYESEYVA